ncbi:hypothetical protein B7494_g5991 [Chlorociboria aeruginascens]|nr:hypothetical protein B7494_g5991 [Chlorociboria aeruginascens]
MASEDLESSMDRRRIAPETGPYVLRSLLEDLPLSADGDRDDIEITCVEFLGTSASEILHFFQIPPDPADLLGKPSYILASRLPPAYDDERITAPKPGVMQILLLPKVNKACILCNWTVTFYSLPELSPVFGPTQIRQCNWIGGIDLNMDSNTSQQDERNPAVTVLVSLNRRMRVVKIGEEARALKSIDFAGSTISVRRDTFACVADSRAYALLDIDHQLKIPLFPISSLDNSQSGGRVEDISGSTGGNISRSTSSAHGSLPSENPDDRGHGRSTSLGTFMSGTSRRQRAPSGERGETPDLLFRDPSSTPTHQALIRAQRAQSPVQQASQADKPLPPPPESSTADQSTLKAPVYLKPYIVSPTPQEFLLVTGTGPRDPGVGMFVNLDGDVTRSTLEFEKYPSDIVVDGRGVGVDPSPANINQDEEGFVLASIARDQGEELYYGLEIQRWDLDPGEDENSKFWLEVPATGARAKEKSTRIGLRVVIDPGDVYFDEVVDRLRLKRFQPFARRSMDESILSLRSVDSRTATSLERVSAERELFESADSPAADGWEEQRNEEELQFARRLGRTRSRIVSWSGKSIFWTVRNPLALRLDGELSVLISNKIREDLTYPPLDRRKVIEVVNSLRGCEAKTETEYLSLGYIRQRAGLLLFMSVLDALAVQPSEPEYRITEDALLEGGLDPRVILAIVPFLRNEIVEGKTGIWVHGGVKDTADNFITNGVSDGKAKESIMSDHILQFLRRYLTGWRRKKGFGSVASGPEVFRSVEAALLVVLLQLDESSPKGLAKAKANSIRADLYDLVDHEIDCFDRAVSLLESHHRLYVLSRLYHSRKMSAEILATWRRIIEGDFDEGGEFLDGENKVREYLAKIRNPALVQEYGVWLAARNPKLGVRVFAEDRSHVKFEPTQVVSILREGAPGAVKDYLEHLVFQKNHTEYINELIVYYLDIVTSKLEGSEEARSILAQSYESYRALRPPKPTYRQFITDNTIDEEWWHSRLRLLQLLGGSQGSTSQYDVAAILIRIAPYTQELVPEVIILDGRQSHHEEALRLLTHGLGDYDTAITYCLLGGSSMYQPISGTVSLETLPTREEQSKLFSFLLSEFLLIEDLSNQIEQTSNLLERFGGWFDVAYVLSLIPDSWSVELVSGFLVSALRRIVRERSETMVAKALSGAENLKISADLIKRIDEVGPEVEAQRS